MLSAIMVHTNDKTLDYFMIYNIIGNEISNFFFFVEKNEIKIRSLENYIIHDSNFDMMQTYSFFWFVRDVGLWGIKRTFKKKIELSFYRSRKWKASSFVYTMF